ncbi:MAG: ABC transporter permease [Bacteroidales bacterium]
MLFHFALRSIISHPLLNGIKVLGLALGLTGILFITLFIRHEFSYDTFHPNAKRIYRITTTSPQFLKNSHFARIPSSEHIPDLAEYFTGIESFVRLVPVRGGVIKHDERYFKLTQGYLSDSTFFNIFSAELLSGDKKTVLNEPGSMVVSESFAKKVFGTANPAGKVLSIPMGQYYGERTDFIVRGVMKDFPRNSHFHPEFITTPSVGDIGGWAFTYLLLSDKVAPENITEGYSGFLSERVDGPDIHYETKAYLQNISDIYLHSHKLREIEVNGNITNIYVFLVAALVLLLICISNYANLTLGMTGFKNKFIYISRILGSSKRMTLYYFLTESLLIIGASAVLTTLIFFQANSTIISYFGINLIEGQTMFIILVVILFSILGLIAGIQPMFKTYINESFQKTGKALYNFRNIRAGSWIIIVQYSLVIFLIVSVIVISRQTNYAITHSLGVEEDNIFCIENVHSDVQKRFELFKSELLKYHSIESVSAMMEPPGGEANDMFPFELEGRQRTDQQEDERIGVFPCDYSFPEVFNLEFIAGRNFTEHNADADGSGEYIINESAMNYFNYTDPGEIAGKGFKLISTASGVDLPAGRIIGVVKDFHLSSMKEKVRTLVLFKREDLWLINFVVSHNDGMREAAIADIHEVWEEMFGEYPLEFEHVGSMYRKVYRSELLQSGLLTIFSFVSLFICSMGLLGMSLLVIQQRTKEIGIRKVNGAKASEILNMLNKDIVKLVVLAFLFAIPAAWYAMSRWLQNFAYQTELSWWIFALAGVIALGIAMLTVSWQSWSAARRNPVEALRYE